MPTVAAININDLPKVGCAHTLNIRDRIPDSLLSAVQALLLNIFSRLDQRALSLHVAPVCRAWHRLARSRQFWRELTFDGTRCGESWSGLRLISLTFKRNQNNSACV